MGGVVLESQVLPTSQAGVPRPRTKNGQKAGLSQLDNSRAVLFFSCPRPPTWELPGSTHPSKHQWL